MILLVSTGMRGMGRCGAVEMNSVLSCAHPFSFAYPYQSGRRGGLEKPILAIIGQEAGYSRDWSPVYRIQCNV